MGKKFFRVFFWLSLLIAVSIPSVSMAAGPQEQPTIMLGARGDNVRIVQKYLADSGFYAGDIDGIFGPITAKAVKEFQHSSSLNVNGIVDKETFAYLGRLAGMPSRYSRALSMKASAYSAYDPGNGSYTYGGNLLRKGLAAVDPAVIPLGTRLYIPGYGYAIADDIGGAIKGQRIDLAFDNRHEALNFGVQRVTVYVVDG
ncbi:peptidoglycan-binding protein [Sporomusa sp. KB1]|uniref:peptidoglycan-binding protein n=1 Tax=Sporomusa sp. KB1 TaxID=943346 RepID=UPI0021034A60|nr:peptidoglycan-binding protein [Sporomusa sp. KB1]